MNQSTGNRAGTVAAILFAGLLAIFFLFPLYWMIILGTNSQADIYHFPPPLLPGTSLMQNFKRLIETIPFFLSMWNSLYVALFHTLLVLFFCSFAGYGFARFKDAPGNRWLFGFAIATIMIPGVAGLIPWFLLMKALGWLNTYWPLIIPGAASAFGIFWMHQYIREAIPYEIYESSKMDGASDWRTYWQIVLPLIRPGLAALGVLTFLGVWNNFQTPLIVLNDVEKFTVPLALTNLNTLYSTDVPATMLGTTISVLPIFTAFLLGTKHFIAGLTSGSVKS